MELQASDQRRLMDGDELQLQQEYNDDVISRVDNDDAVSCKAKTRLEAETSTVKPFFYCRFVTRYPISSFLLMLSGHIILAATTVMLLAIGYDIFPTYFRDLPIDLNDIPYKSRSYAWFYRNAHPNATRRMLRDPAYSFWIRKVESYSFTVDILYETEGENIFTKENLKMIQKIENDLMTGKNYFEFCATKDPTLVCKGVQSITQYFDGTQSNIHPIFNDTNFENIAAVLYEASKNIHTKDKFKYFLPQTYTLTTTSAYATLTRTKFPIGYPSPKSPNEKGDIEKPTKDFLRNEIKPKLINWKNSVKSFKIYYISWLYFFDELAEQTVYDMYFAGGSLCFIFCFMVVHTRSFWITFWAVFSICTSYLGTNLIYRCAIGYKYFGYFHIVVIFIILGIGADDLFVFYDTWRLTSSTTYTSLAHRLADAYSKSMYSMFITSLTTSVAFFVSALSPFLCTKSFGIFAGILVLINYISIISFFPTVVIMFHVKFENCRCCFCCNKNKKLSLTASSNSGIELDISRRHETSEKYEDCHYDINSASVNHLVLNSNKPHRTKSVDLIYNANDMSGRTSEVLDCDMSVVERRTYSRNHHQLTSKSLLLRSDVLLVVFMRDCYFKLITKKSMRFLILLFFTVVLVFFIYSATRLTPDTEKVQFFKSDHNLAKARYLTVHGFQKSDEDRYISIYILWGIKHRDLSGCNFTSVECKGKQVYDDDFDPNPPENQLALKMFCNRLYNLSEKDVSNLRIRKSSDGKLQIACFTRSIEEFFQRILPTVKNLTNEDISSFPTTLPWNYNQSMNLMNLIPQYYHDRFNKSYTQYLDIPLQFWILNGNTLTYSPDFTQFNGLIGEQMTSFSRKPVFGFPTYYGNKIKYFAIQINTTIDKYDTSYVDGIPIVERWETFVNQLMKTMPKGVQNGFQLTEFTWNWMYVQKAMAQNAIFGIVLGVLLAFPIITITTMNIVIGFLATFTICCTTVCVVGVIPLAGWKLGLLVSINLCLVVGLSVDYVVHLAEGYHLSTHKDRLSRTRDMLESMGSPIISGAITTLGAALFLFFCKIQFALQFGVFLFCNIGFSLLFSLGLFSTLMGYIGPENDTGSLKNIFKYCSMKKIKGSQK